jgi:hypothetical protein
LAQSVAHERERPLETTRQFMNALRARLVGFGMIAGVLLAPMSCAAQWRPIGGFDVYFVDDSTNLAIVVVERRWRTAWLFLDDSSKAELRGRYTLDTMRIGTPPNVIAMHHQLTIPPRGSASARLISKSQRRYAIVFNADDGRDFITVIVEPPLAHGNRSVGYWCSGACRPRDPAKGHSVILERQIK